MCFLRAAAAAALAACCLARPLAARAYDLRGYIQVQYQKLQNGEIVPVTFDREYWVTSFQVNYTTKLRQDLTLASQVQFTNLDYTHNPEGSRQPYLSLRLLHPYAGFFGAYRPTTQTDILGAESKQEQGVLSGYFARPKWPRLDLNWVRRKLTQENFGGVGTTRNAQLGYVNGPVTLRAGYTDINNEPDQAAQKSTLQQAWNAGGSYVYSRARENLLLQYDFTDNQRKTLTQVNDIVQTHTATLNAGKRFTARDDIVLYYLFRRTDTQDAINSQYNDHESSLLYNHRVRSFFVLSAGAGGRTVRNGLSSEFEKYVLGTATANGLLRHNWTGMAGVTYSLNWLQSGQSYPTNTYTASTVMNLRRGLDVNGAANVTVNGRPVLAVSDSSGNTISGRVSSQFSAGGTLTPRRPFSLTYTFTGYNAGPSLTESSARSTTGAWDLRWYMLSTLQFTGNLTNTNSRGNSQPAQQTSRANLQWNPSRYTQLTGAYTRSDYTRVDPTIPRVPTRETVNLTFLTALSRYLTGNVSFNWSDPGTKREVEQLDAMVTRRFGG